MIGDKAAIERGYLAAAAFLLGALVVFLVLADRAAAGAVHQRRDDRRRHSEDLALQEARADRHEQDIATLGVLVRENADAALSWHGANVRRLQRLERVAAELGELPDLEPEPTADDDMPGLAGD